MAASGKKNPFFSGFLTGLAVGLGLALVVAWLVTRNNPFTEQASTQAVAGTASAPPVPAEAPKYEFHPAPNEGDAQQQAAELVSGVAYFLQAGAFASAADADEMKARLALLGFEAKTLAMQENGGVLYKSRIGPYRSLDELNRARARLTQGGIETMLVKTGPKQEEKP